MLRITQSQSAAAAKEYARNALSRGDYYMEGQEIAGNWAGRGARMLGLQGKISREDFFALLDNKRPDGRPLTAKTVVNRRPGYDFTFDLPKSVSVLFAVGGDDRIRGAMERAIGATMREMEKEMHARVRKNGAFEDRKTGNMIWADFTHLTSRPAPLNRATESAFLRAWPSLEKYRDEDGYLALPDPHLHCHVYVLNATYDETEEMWKAGEFMRIKRDASYYQATYHARLAGELQKLGYEIEPTANAFEIAGVARGLIEVFSRRTKEIEEKARELGITDEDRKAELGAMTRRGKAAGAQMGELRMLWRGFLPANERAKIEAIASKAVAARNPIERDSPDAAAAAIRYALGHELERLSVVSEKRLLGRALMQSVGRASVATVWRELDKTQGIVPGMVEGERTISTKEILAEESVLMRFVREGRGAMLPLVRASDGGFKFHTPLFRASGKETQEQREAVMHLMGSQDWVVGLVGRAGTGKTTLLHEIEASVTAIGKKLVMCAPTAEAARGVLRGEGFHSADTVKRLLVDRARHSQLRGNVLWVDEAGMVGNRDMLALLQLAKREGAARVVLAGDPSQIRSVPRGDALRFLEEKAGLSVARLDGIKRQRSPELKAVVHAISRGNVEEGLSLLDKNKGIVEVDTREAWRALATGYVDKIAERANGRCKTALVICPTHREGEQITEAIREELKARGEIVGKDMVVPRTVNLSWTEQERASAASYEPGLLVQFKAHAPGFQKGERARVVDVSARDGAVLVRKNNGDVVNLSLTHAQRFAVYAVRELPVAAGDKLKITQNCTLRDLRFREGRSMQLNNGDTVAVAGFTQEGGVVLKDGKVLPRNFGHLAHGYVITADSAQAKTVDSVFIGVGQDSMAAVDMRRAYVAISRARDEARIYTDDKAGLFRVCRRDTERMSATELVGEDRAEIIFRNMERQELRRRQERAIEAPVRARVIVREPPQRRREMEMTR